MILLDTHKDNNFNVLRDVKGNLSSALIKDSRNEILVKEIIESTSFLESRCSMSERIYCIVNGLTARPVCSLTGVSLKWSPGKKRYNLSKKNGYNYRSTNSDNIKNRYKSIRDNLTVMYNSGNYKKLLRAEVIDKIKQYTTNIKLWDIEKDYNLFCSVLAYTDFLDDSSNWGERFYCLNNNISSRVVCKDGGFAKYINSVIGYSTYSSKKDRHAFMVNSIIDSVGDRFEFIDQIYNIQEQQKIRIKCKLCGNIKRQLFICGHWQKICCNKCTGYGINRSKAEDEIGKYIENMGLEVLYNHKIGGKEVDLFIPDKQVAIEYTGILWHSFGKTYPSNIDLEPLKKYNHSNKQKICAAHNIKLLTIFETEWLFKQNIVKSIIGAKLGLSSRKVFARKCSVKILTKQEKSQFYKDTHIQGNCQSFYDIGLLYGGELVCALSLTKRKIAKHNNIELARFSCSLNTSVIGGFSKLLKYAMREITGSIISYCDLRYSTGNVYLRNGFTLKNRTHPNYFYTKDCINLESRLKYQKHKLTDKLNYNINDTETTVMYNSGYRKIYDCGNLAFVINPAI